MRPQKKAKPWSCLTCSFAMVADIWERDLFAWIGHDGGELLGSDDSIDSRRGFHIQEIIEALDRVDMTVTQIEKRPVLRVKGKNFLVWEDEDWLEHRFVKHMRHQPGVVIGKSINYDWFHALAWDGVEFINPDTGAPPQDTVLEYITRFFKVTNATY